MLEIEIKNESFVHFQPTRDYDLVYADPPYFTGRDFGAYSDQMSHTDYRLLIENLFSTAVQCLRPSGVLVIQCDWRATHLIRTISEQFDLEYESEIIWSYSSGGASNKRLARKHDTLHGWRFPTSSRNDKGSTFNVIREPYATPNVQGRKGFHSEGRMLVDVWSDNELVTDSTTKDQPPEEMSFLETSHDFKGKVTHSYRGGEVWKDIGILSTTAKERTGYPTQKPVLLMERILKLYTNEGDWIIDLCAGSGTTGAAARNLNRNVTLLDVGEEACQVMQDRLV